MKITRVGNIDLNLEYLYLLLLSRVRFWQSKQLLFLSFSDTFLPCLLSPIHHLCPQIKEYVNILVSVVNRVERPTFSPVIDQNFDSSFILISSCHVSLKKKNLWIKKITIIIVFLMATRKRRISLLRSFFISRINKVDYILIRIPFHSVHLKLIKN